jgi:hypothetical protein
MDMKPILIKNFSLRDSQQTVPLQQIDLDEPPYDEKWLQDLIHKYPNLVPAHEIETCCRYLIPVATEFPLKKQFLDNLFFTPDGFPVLVEVKLYKNTESRRKVVTQAIEYAMEFCDMKYDTINQIIRQQQPERLWKNNPLYELIKSPDGISNTPDILDEASFTSNVIKNLKEGSFLLLILGDGIRPEMASLAEFMTQHTLRYSFGIIQVQLYQMSPDEGIIAIPSVIAQTQLIKRDITVVTTSSTDTNTVRQIPVVSERTEKTSLSLAAFYETMTDADLNFIREVLESLSDLDVEAEIGSNGKNLMLKKTLISDDGKRLQFMLITPSGAEFWGIPYREWKYPDWQKLSISYLERIACLVTGATVKILTTQADVKINNNKLPLNSLHGKSKEFAEAIRQVIQDAESFYTSNSQ